MNLAVVLVAVVLGCRGRRRPSPPPAFGDQKSSWHGFDHSSHGRGGPQHQAEQGAPDEGNAVRTQINGHFRCVVVAPKEAGARQPWSWQGY
jgi:hypothetical protein